MSTAIRSCSTLPTIERIDRIELPLSRLLLVLSHHPDLVEWTHEITKDMIKWVVVPIVPHNGSYGSCADMTLGTSIYSSTA